MLFFASVFVDYFEKSREPRFAVEAKNGAYLVLSLKDSLKLKLACLD